MALMCTHQVRESDKLCVDIGCVLLTLGLIAVLANMANS